VSTFFSLFFELFASHSVMPGFKEPRMTGKCLDVNGFRWNSCAVRVRAILRRLGEEKTYFVGKAEKSDLKSVTHYGKTGSADG